MDDDKSSNILRPSKPQDASATFGQGNLSVHVNAENLSIHPSSLNALERISAANPEIASQLIKASERALDVDARKFQTAAIGSMLVALAIIAGAVAVIITTGIFAGIVFFAACVAASAIITTLLTGKLQDISWTVRLFGGSDRPHDPPD